MKSLVLCADDYGVTRAAGVGIRKLIGLGRLSAVSCLVGFPCWIEEAALLNPLRDRVDVGLHFNLTLGGEVRLARLLKDCLTGKINRGRVERQLHQQLDRFESAWMEPPDFVDGHHHVHIFPGVRGPLFQVLAERYPVGRRPWVRQVKPSLFGHDALVKALVLRILATGFEGTARKAKLTISGDFAGLYSQAPRADYPALMDRWLGSVNPGTLIMCHPSASAEGAPEGTGEACTREFVYLAGEDFGASLAKNNVQLVRFRHRDP